LPLQVEAEAAAWAEAQKSFLRQQALDKALETVSSKRGGAHAVQLAGGIVNGDKVHRLQSSNICTTGQHAGGILDASACMHEGAPRASCWCLKHYLSPCTHL
jgi:hypothetical protein